MTSNEPAAPSRGSRPSEPVANAFVTGAEGQARVALGALVSTWIVFCPTVSTLPTLSVAAYLTVVEVPLTLKAPE